MNLAERTFIDVALSNGYWVKKTPLDDDRYNHVDFLLMNDTTKAIKGFDVKGEKSIWRGGSPDSNYIWVEFENGDGYNGWIYGKADFIAFHNYGCFIVVERDKLKQLAEKLVDRGKVVDKPEEALHCIYRRDGRKDSISLLRTTEVKEIAYAIWRNDTVEYRWRK